MFVKSHRPNRVTSLWLGLSLLLGVLGQAQEETQESLVLQLKWTHQFQFAGYYMAKELGYYRDAGMEVEIREGSPNLNVTEEVLSGRADFGVGTSSLLLDYAEGKPVVVLGVIYQHSPLALVMRAEKSSDTIESISEGPIMIESHAGDLLAMLHRAGLNLEDLNIIERPSNALQLLEENEGIRTSSAYITDEPYTLDQKGIPHVTFTPRSYGVDFYGDNFFTTKSMVKDRRDLALSFRDATIRGWQAALQNPEKTVDLILEKYPNGMSREKLLYEALITQDLMTNLVAPGHMNKDRWQHIAETYQETGMMGKAPHLKGFIFEVKQRLLPKWFWSASGGSLALVLLLSAVALKFKSLNEGLHKEVVLRRETEQNLMVTNQKLQLAMAKTEEVSDQKSWFIANVSHDLRAPISAMISLANIFDNYSRNVQLPDKFTRFIKQLNSGSEFLMLMLNNILDFSVFEKGAAAAHRERVTFDQCSSGIINLARPLADEREVKIEVNKHCDQEVLVIDRTRLSQIILNLLHNAIKFSPRGGSVRVSFTLEGERLEIVVHDQGPGICPEDQKHVFEMFTQGDKRPTRYSGNGLGLTIVHRHTEFLKGSIQIEQAQPTGAIFRVNIPLLTDSSEKKSNLETHASAHH